MTPGHLIRIIFIGKAKEILITKLLYHGGVKVLNRTTEWSVFQRKRRGDVADDSATNSQNRMDGNLGKLVGKRGGGFSSIFKNAACGRKKQPKGKSRE